MAPKTNNSGRGQRSKTPGQTSASDPNPTATSPSASAPTGDATTASLVPFSAYPSAPPTTTTTRLIPSTPPPTTSLLPISPSQITATTQTLPWPQPLPIRKTGQEGISCTSDGATTTTDHAGPSTAPSASAAASTDDFMSLHATAFEDAMAAVQRVNEEESTPLHDLNAILFGCRLEYMEPTIKGLLKVAELMKDDAEMKEALEALADVEFFKSTIRAAKMLLAEGKKPEGSGGSCSGSKGAGGGPDSGSGEGDGEGGGVSV